MPLTKKKGAIFAIYADTPPRAGSSSTASSSLPASPSATPASAHTERKPSRPALAALEPAPTKSATRTKGFPSSSTSESSGPSKTRRAVSPLPSSSRNPTASGASTSSTGRRTRKLEVFSDPDPAPSKAGTRTLEPSKPLPSALQPKPLSAASSSKPTSKDGSKEKSKPLAPKSSSSSAALKVKRARSPIDKENLPDSPASRTRSKARLASAALQQSENTSQSLQAKLAAAAKKPTAKKTQKAFTVFADNALADVSEAYGASGEEPAGFRDQASSSSVQKTRSRALVSVGTFSLYVDPITDGSGHKSSQRDA